MSRQEHQATKTTMPRKKLAHNAACPCGSGKQYGDCCYDKGFEYLVDEDRAEWEAAVLEYRAKHGDDAPEEDEDNEWF